MSRTNEIKYSFQDVLKMEIVSTILAEVVSNKFRNELNKIIALNNYEFKPRISYIDLMILHELQYNDNIEKGKLREIINDRYFKHNKVNVVFEHLLERLNKLKLIEVDCDNVKITKFGVKVISYATEVYDIVLDTLQEDSLLGTLHKMLDV